MTRADNISKLRPEGDEPERPRPEGEAAQWPEDASAPGPEQAAAEGEADAAPRRRARRKRLERRRARAERRRWSESEEAGAGADAAEPALDEDIFDEDPLAAEDTAEYPPPRRRRGGGGGRRGRRRRGSEEESEESGGEQDGLAGSLVARPEDYLSIRPEPRRPGLARLWALLPLLLLVGLPTALGAWYYGWVASDLYYTETRISVRSPGAAAAPSLMSSAIGGIQLGSASIEADSIAEFATSHDAVRQLMQQVDLREIFSREGGDWLTRLAPDASFEDLVEHYRKRVEVVYNEANGIITIGARTFRPEDSQAILDALNGVSERLVNAFNARAEADALRLARAEVDRAEERMAEARSELLRFRLANQELDPEQRSGSILSIISGLEAEYAEVSAQLGEMRAYMEPDSLQITSLRNRLSGLEEQIRAEERRLTGGVDGDRRYANVLNDYELLTLERELAHQDYTSAISSLEGARVEAQRQQTYLVTIVAPHEAEVALFPKRLENIGLIFLASLLAFLIGRLIVTGIQDHLMN